MLHLDVFHGSWNGEQSVLIKVTCNVYLFFFFDITASFQGFSFFLGTNFTVASQGGEARKTSWAIAQRKRNTALIWKNVSTVTTISILSFLSRKAVP